MAQFPLLRRSSPGCSFYGPLKQLTSPTLPVAETLFQQVQYPLTTLMQYIAIGEVGLPDIQRPFVWKNAKIRDLFDSMYRGFPVGYLLFWHNAMTDDSRSIGSDVKQKPARLLIVDGQQRLTSLYAVVKGIPVLREDYQTERIEIAFSPLEERFEVADAATRRDPSFIPSISELWRADTDVFEVAERHLATLEHSRPLDAEEKKRVKKAISRLNGLLNYPFTALELASSIGEEEVSEVFVRINSKGKPLNQADFILTLMSVFWDSGRAELEAFSRSSRMPAKGKSPYNHFLQPSPDQLLRAAVGLGFKRARLQFVYSILRGKDLQTEVFSASQRDAQFAVLKGAQERVLHLQYWHDFFHAIRQAGYRSAQVISSQTALIYAYVLYLMGRTELGVDEFELRRVVSRWFFMSSLTGRYTSSHESTFEFDLARFREVRDGASFVSIVDAICDERLTPDYWSITLPSELATSASRSPALFAYYAALVLLDANALFSRQSVSDLLDPSVKAHRSAAERHHLFAKGYLAKIGYSGVRETNQIANYALIEWGDNASVSALPPEKYVPKLAARFKGRELQEMYRWHALPDGWESMEYHNFLMRRRELIAGVISDGYARLAPTRTKPTIPKRTEASIGELVRMGETPSLEFKSTLRTNLHTREKDPRIEQGVLKTIVGFLNGGGGTLIIGVADDGTPVGVQEDAFANEDKMLLHLGSLISSRIGNQYSMYIHPHFDDFESVRVLTVQCHSSRSPVFLKEGDKEHLYIRAGNSTVELTGKQSLEYIRQRFG